MFKSIQLLIKQINYMDRLDLNHLNQDFLIIFLDYFQKKNQEEIFLWDLLLKIKIYLTWNHNMFLNQNNY